MIKQTLMFTLPASLSLKDNQIVIQLKGAELVVTRPIEDIGVVVVENQQVNMTIPLLNALVENNVSVVFCDKRQMPKREWSVYYLSRTNNTAILSTSGERKRKKTVPQNLCNWNFFNTFANGKASHHPLLKLRALFNMLSYRGIYYLGCGLM